MSSPLLKRAPALYLNQSDLWYGKKNHETAQKLNEAGIQDTLTFDAKSTKPKALLVFGDHKSLAPEYHLHWMKSLVETHDVMVITVRKYSELNTWFQNIIAKVESVSIVLLNVHGNPSRFTFNPEYKESEVLLGNNSFIPHFSSLLKEGGEALICGCSVGKEPFILEPSRGILKEACVARKLAMALGNATVCAPTRSISSQNIFFSNGRFSFKDGDDDITAVFKGNHIAGLSCEDLLPFPNLLRSQLKDLSAEKLQTLFHDSANRFFLPSALEILKVCTPEERKKHVQHFLGTSLVRHFWGWEKDDLSSKSNPWSPFLQDIEDMRDDPFKQLPQLNTLSREHLERIFLDSSSSGQKNLFLSSLNFAKKYSLRISDSSLLKSFDIALSKGAFSFCKSIIEYTSRLKKGNDVFKKCFSILPDVVKYQPREMVDLFKYFEKYKDFTCADLLFDRCYLHKIALKLDRVEIWLKGSDSKGVKAITHYKSIC